MRWPWSKKQLEPGKCQCGHERSYHHEGRGRCYVDMSDSASDEEKERFPHAFWSCACQVYIPDKDDNDGDDKPHTPVDPEVNALEKMVGLKK
jgi:hypothetical protein